MANMHINSTPNPTIYLNIVDEVNQRSFVILTSETFGPISQAYAQGEIEPIYSPSVNDKARCRLNIPQMCLLVKNKYPFTIVDDKDLVDMYKLLVRYLDWVHEEMNLFKNAEVKTFVDDCLFLLKVLTPIYERYLNRMQIKGFNLPEIKQRRFEKFLTSLFSANRQDKK